MGKETATLMWEFMNRKSELSQTVWKSITCVGTPYVLILNI